MSINIEVQELPPVYLEFGSPGEFTDQKEGLTQAGPFDLRFGGAHKSQVKIGLVGPAPMIEQAYRWVERCQNQIVSKMDNHVQYPLFPGFKNTFKATLTLADHWVVDFDKNPGELERLLQLLPKERFEKVVDLYTQGIQRISNLEIKPDVVFCCIPESVVKLCWSITRDITEKEWKTIYRRKKVQAQAAESFTADEQLDESGTEDLLYRDFRRVLKARSMKLGIPIQLAREALLVDSDANQDAATRAWNMSVALYYKSGGIPWRIKNKGPETCFVGISFHHFKTNKRHLVRSSIAQAFSTEGDGFALRGDAIPWDPRQGMEVHLTEEQAARLAGRVLEQYRILSGGEPMRVVLHKTSKFSEAETAGFKSALRNIPIVEQINLSPSMFRLVQFGAYPPKRGTLCRVNKDSTYLFTSGYIPEWKTYPGPHIPAPLRIITNPDIDIHRAATDILGLTRMNWNTAMNTNSQPVTLRFAREVGSIMAEVNEGEERPSYRFYM